MKLSIEQISYLWQRYVAQKATNAEVDALFTAIKDVSGDEENMRLFHAVLENYPPTKQMDEILQQEMLKQVLSSNVNKRTTSLTVDSPTAHRIHFLRTTWFRYAASILLLLGVATTYLWLNNKKGPVVKTVSNLAAITPGRERALLTLANGEQVVLDSAQGDIVRQGNLKVINLNGKLDYKGKTDVVEYHTLSTPKGGQYKIQLPDGTNVWLNAASSITYPTAFLGNERMLTVTGEAYFEVTKNAQQPFRIKINDGASIEVLGTNFNINAYSNETSIKATLLEGSIKLIKNGKEQLLQPGEQGTITGAGLTVSKVNAAEAIAWKNGLFNFNGADLPTVMRQLERWYDIDVKYEDGKSRKTTFRGKLPRDLNLAQLIETLEDVNIKFRLEGRTLIIK